MIFNPPIHDSSACETKAPDTTAPILQCHYWRLLPFNLLSSALNAATDFNLCLRGKRRSSNFGIGIVYLLKIDCISQDAWEKVNHGQINWIAIQWLRPYLCLERWHSARVISAKESHHPAEDNVSWCVNLQSVDTKSPPIQRNQQSQCDLYFNRWTWKCLGRCFDRLELIRLHCQHFRPMGILLLIERGGHRRSRCSDKPPVLLPLTCVRAYDFNKLMCHLSSNLWQWISIQEIFFKYKFV